MATLSAPHYVVNGERLAWGATAAAVVVLGVIAKNGIDEAGWGQKVGTYVGAPIFVVGWILVAVALSLGKQGKLGLQIGIWIASALILVSAMAASMAMSHNETPNVAWPVIFGVAWLALGWMAGNSVRGSVAGLFGGICVIASMMFLLPLQRQHDVVDGPGMPLFVFGWTLVVMAHAVVAVLPKK